MIKHICQYILDRLIYFVYKKKIVINNSSYCWCHIPVPLTCSQQSQTHPSIIYLETPWNGSSLWMGTTPYPNAKVEYENPCVYYIPKDSISKTGFIPIKSNPILEWPGGQRFNSDVELYFTNQKLYAISREYNLSNLHKKIYLQFSENGQDWSSPSLIFETFDANKELLSPSIIKIEDKLRMYCLNGNSGIYKKGVCTGITILEAEGLEEKQFKEIKNGSFTNKEDVGIEPWHCSVFLYENKMYMLFCGRNNKKKSLRSLMETYLAVSDDFENFHIYEKPIISHLKTYRPSAYIENDNLHLYFSVVSYIDDFNEDRRIGYTKLNMKELLDCLSN